MSVSTNFFLDYANRLFRNVPQETYEGVVSILCIGCVTFLVWKGFKKGIRYTALLALTEYLLLLFCTTVFLRETKEIREYNYHPFWSYGAMETNPDFMMAENIMNVLVFVPIGFLFCIAFNGMKWWIAILLGVIISFGIELLQLLLMKGFSEMDDVIHNTIGFILGYLIALTIKSVSCLINTKIYGK
jgi:glycopeptide antibiotics resistance protein